MNAALQALRTLSPSNCSVEAIGSAALFQIWTKADVCEIDLFSEYARMTDHAVRGHMKNARRVMIEMSDSELSEVQNKLDRAIIAQLDSDPSAFLCEDMIELSAFCARIQMLNAA